MLKHSLEIGLGSGPEVQHNPGQYYLEYLSCVQLKMSLQDSESPGQGEGLPGEPLCTHSTLDTQEGYSEAKIRQLNFNMEKKEIKVFGTTAWPHLNQLQQQQRAREGSSQGFLQQEKPTSKALST